MTLKSCALYGKNLGFLSFIRMKVPNRVVVGVRMCSKQWNISCMWECIKCVESRRPGFQRTEFSGHRKEIKDCLIASWRTATLLEPDSKNIHFVENWPFQVFSEQLSSNSIDALLEWNSQPIYGFFSWSLNKWISTGPLSFMRGYITIKQSLISFLCPENCGFPHNLCTLNVLNTFTIMHFTVLNTFWLRQPYSGLVPPYERETR